MFLEKGLVIHCLIVVCQKASRLKQAVSIALTISVVICTAALKAQGQVATTVTTPQQAYITAEPIPVTITITDAHQHSLLITADTLGPYLILQRNNPTYTQTSTGYISTENLLLAALDSGNLTIPAIAISGLANSFTDSVTLLITRPPADSLQEFKPLKMWPTPLKEPINWLLATAIVALMILVFFLLLRAQRRKRKKVHTLPEPIAILPSLSAWQKLEKAWISKEISAEELGNSWMQLFRQQAGLAPAKPQTLAAFEITNHYKKQLQPTHLQELIKQLSICQAAQFGLMHTSPQDGLQLIQFGSSWLKNLKQ